MIHPIAKVSEEVNRKLPAVALSTLYNDPELHNAQRQRQTNNSAMPIADHTVCCTITRYLTS